MAAESSSAYALHPLLSSLPIPSTTGVTCVDFWNSNLYIGTSTGEVLHYVHLPPSDYIFASRLEPPSGPAPATGHGGIQQILVLPDAGRACILNNGTLTFYSLPELSPAFGGIKQGGCLWVGGVDEDESAQHGQGPGSVVVICLKQRLRLIKIGNEARKLRDIELPGVGAVQRRGELVCVADGAGSGKSGSYSLLDVGNLRKNELFPVSSLSSSLQQREDEDAGKNSKTARSFSLTSASPTRQPRGHERNVSLGAQLAVGNERLLRPESGSGTAWPARASSRQAASPTQPGSRERSPAGDGGSVVTSARTSGEVPRAPLVVPKAEQIEVLPPNIVAPTRNEFLLTTGTRMSEPGVGMFVNLDGDVVRGTIEFSSYPSSVVLDNTGLVGQGDVGGEGYVLAVVTRDVDGARKQGIEVQRWNDDSGEAHVHKDWIAVDSDTDEMAAAGLRNATTTSDLAMPKISQSLRLRRLPLGDDTSVDDSKRDAEEDTLASRFDSIPVSVLLYHQSSINWVARIPLLLRLDRQLDSAITQSPTVTIDVPAVQSVVNSIRGQDAQDELEFLTLTYIRQKASIILLGDLALRSQRTGETTVGKRDKLFAEEALAAGDIDPRVVLTLVQPLDEETIVGAEGLWLSEGIVSILTVLRNALDPQSSKGGERDDVLQIIKRYLLLWRSKKGFGSVSDEKHVFVSVDAALLRVLLLLDFATPPGPAAPGSVRAELNEVVDHGVECFERAVGLFGQERRLYMLSRLYQSRKMAAKVLETWKRILEGEEDKGGELVDGEAVVARYLTKRGERDRGLVREYGTWLAVRNPKLGVRVFSADEGAKLKWEVEDVVGLLRERAPGAVKWYLEQLVFAGKEGRMQGKYINDLIAYYLDTVLTALDADDGEAKPVLEQSYETYRAMRPPDKPTYRQFITDNALSDEWWQNRLRLLQLLGASGGAYDVSLLRKQLEGYAELLVPEMIIVNGREGRHEEALRLLVRGLGDYDTAIRYCLLCGSSIFQTADLGGASALPPGASLPTKYEQSRLFRVLLTETLRMQDISERLERTGELLERFGGWFDVREVLELIPDEWAVELVEGFLVTALRALVRERHETVVVKGLCSTQNLRVTGEMVEKIAAMGPVVVGVEEGVLSGGGG